MSDQKQGVSVNFGFWPGLLTAIFLLLGLTGNCATCGLDRDYLGDYIDAKQ